jgi:hypothetical protein
MRIFFAIILALVATFPENWSVLKSPEFEFYYAPGLERTAKDLFQQAGQIRTRIEGFLDFSFEAPVLMIFAPDRESFLALQPGRVPEWASGTSYPEQRVIFLRPLDATEIRGNNLTTIFTHELAHIMLHHRLNRNRAPRWLDEGVAMYLAGQFSFTQANQLLSVGISGRHIPFRRLAYSFPESGDDAQLAYAQSSDMISYIQRVFGHAAYSTLLDRLAQGDELEAALEKSLGRNLDQLEKEWLNAVRRRWGLVPALTGSLSLWFLISLLFIAAYLRKRKTSRLRRQLWEIEENMENISSSSRPDHYLH